MTNPEAREEQTAEDSLVEDERRRLPDGSLATDDHVTVTPGGQVGDPGNNDSDRPT